MTDMWFREIHPGKWVPISWQGYAVMIVPLIVGMPIMLLPLLLMENKAMAAVVSGAMTLIMLPLILFIIFRMARRHAAPRDTHR